MATLLAVCWGGLGLNRIPRGCSEIVTTGYRRLLVLPIGGNCHGMTWLCSLECTGTAGGGGHALGLAGRCLSVGGGGRQESGVT